MENLGVDLKLLIAQLINFGLFFILYKKFIAKPFISIMNEEKKKDEQKKAILALAEEQKNKLKEEETKAREQIRKKLEESIVAAQQAGEATRESIVKKAQAEANEIVAKTKRELEDERKKLEHDYKDTITKVSVLTVEHALKDFLTDEMKKEVNKRILTNLSEQKNHAS